MDNQFQGALPSELGLLSQQLTSLSVIDNQITGTIPLELTGLSNLENLLLHPYFKDAVETAQAAWRKVVVVATQMGLPVPAFSTALAYYDSYRREFLPANLLQAQRDYFGAHTYKRTDREGTFHTEWLDLRKPPVE